MRAPSTEELYKFEHYVESAFEKALWRDGIEAHTQRSKSTLRSPYVSLRLEMGEARGQKAKDAQGRWQYCAWNASLVIGIVTSRTQDKVDHEEFRARIRNLLRGYPQAFLPESLPYHQIPLLKPSGSSPNIEAKDDLDVSVLSYQLVIYIRPGAWPLAV